MSELSNSIRISASVIEHYTCSRRSVNRLVGLVSLFKGISTFVGCLMPKTPLSKNRSDTYRWGYKEFHTFRRGINLKVKVIAWLVFEPAYFETTIKRPHWSCWISVITAVHDDISILALREWIILMIFSWLFVLHLEFWSLRFGSLKESYIQSRWSCKMTKIALFSQWKIKISVWFNVFAWLPIYI